MTRWSLSIPVLLAGLGGLNGPATAQTLAEALAAAYANNPTLLAQRAKLRATDEQVAQALSNWRPTVEMAGDAGTTQIENNLSTNRRQFRDPRSLSFTLDQDLYRGGRTIAATREAENTVKAERARLFVVEQTVLRGAGDAFVDVVRDQAVLELNIKNEQRLARQLEATRDRFRVGEVTRTDVSQAESRLALARADRSQAQGDLEISRAAYRNVVGEAPGRLEAPAPLGALPSSWEEAVGISVAENPNVIAADFDARASAYDADEVRGELLPTVSLEGSAKRAFDTAGEESRIDTLAATVTLTVPLYQSGAVYSRLRAARQTLGQQRLLIDEARRAAAESATRGWESLQTARAQIEAFKAAIEAAEIALEGVEREAAVGSRTVLDVLDAEQELLDASVSFVRAQRDEMAAIFDLKVELGHMGAMQLGLDVELYDPDRHYGDVRPRWFGGESSGLPGPDE